MEPRDLTPEEARAEVEAFMGPGWTCGATIVGVATRLAYARRFVAGRTTVEVEGKAPTYRAAVDALKAAWRDAVRPWCVQCANEGHNAVDRHGNIVEGAGSIVARVLKEDS